MADDFDSLRAKYGIGAKPAPAADDDGFASLRSKYLKPAAPAEATTLSPSEEQGYQAWRAKLPKELQYEGDYDLRGFYKENPNFTAAPGQHMTDRYKLPNHKTFSDESKYYNDSTKHLGGRWEGDVFVPNDTRYKQRVDESAPTRKLNQPKELSDEEAGVDTGPITSTVVPVGGVSHTSQPVGSAYPPASDVVRVTERHPGNVVGPLDVHNPLTDNRGHAKTITTAGTLPGTEMQDPLVQMGTAGAMGMAAGAGVAGALGLAGVPAAVAAPVGTAIESGVANKSMGGDFTTGAALGGVPLLKAGARAAGEAVLENAPARVTARAKRNLTEPATQRQADKLARADDAIDGVLERNPDLRHALSVQAKDRPAAALTHVQNAGKTANAYRNGVFDQMEQYWADKPASSQASIPQMLDDYAAVEKTISAGDRNARAAMKAAKKELMAFADDARAARGLPPAVNGDYSGTIVTPKELRAFERTVGSQAFEAVPINARGQAREAIGTAIYRPIARQINQLAENTPGVDAAKLAANGQDIHALIPIEETLQKKVDDLARHKPNFIQAARENAGKIATSVVSGGALASGNIKTAIAIPVGAYAAKKTASAAASAARRIDYRLGEAQMRRLQASQAARAGVTPVPAPAPLPQPGAGAPVGVAGGQAQRQPPMVPVPAM